MHHAGNASDFSLSTASAFTHVINDSLQCCRRLRLRSRWTSRNTFWRRVCALRTSALVTAPCQCRWRSSVSHCLFACVKARNSQLYLLLFEPEQVVIDGVLFLRAISIASCRSIVGHAVPRYGLPPSVRPASSPPAKPLGLHADCEPRCVRSACDQPPTALLAFHSACMQTANRSACVRPATTKAQAALRALCSRPAPRTARLDTACVPLALRPV